MLPKGGSCIDERTEEQAQSAPDVDHTTGWLQESWLTNMMASFFPFHNLPNARQQLHILFTTLQRTREIVVSLREKTGANLAVRSKPYTAAVAAKGMRHRRNNADLSTTVIEGITPCRFRELSRRQRNQGSHPVQSFNNLIQANDHFRRPDAVFFQRHELNEANDDVFRPGKLGKGLDLILIKSAQEHGIHLDRSQTCVLSSANAIADALKAIRHARDAGKGLRIYRIHADRHASQPCGFQITGHRSQHVAVGRHGQIQAAFRSKSRAHSGRFGNQIHNSATQQRLASGETNLLHAYRDKQPQHAGIVRKREFTQGLCAISGAAIDAPEITTVGYRKTKIGDRPAVLVTQAIFQSTLNRDVTRLSFLKQRKRGDGRKKWSLGRHDFRDWMQRSLGRFVRKPRFQYP